MALTLLRRPMAASTHISGRSPLTSTSSTRRITLSSYLVTPKQLATALQQNPTIKISTTSRVIPLCAAWFLPNDPEKRTGLSVFERKHIPGAQFFDLDSVSDTSSPYPHMLPSADKFAEAMGRLGVRKDDEVVVYDTEELGIFSAPRVGWTLKVFGHAKVHVLNNFKIWVQEGHPTESGPPQAVEKVDYPVPVLDQSTVIGFEEVREVARGHGKEGTEGTQILDARSLGRWQGIEPEPRPGEHTEASPE
jgi:thiosulfate/3-mercaptopyruvate sulfurtransferase